MGRLLLASAVCVVLLAGCSGDSADSLLTLTPEQYGTSQSVVLYGTVLLALPDNPSTGYSWHCTWEPRPALKLSREYYVAAGGGDGAGGTRYYELRASRSGRLALTVQYGRWWEGGEVEAPHTFNLVIRP